MVSVAVKPPLSRNDITGLAFYIQGRIYRDGARRLLRTSRRLEWFDPVPYFLLCQSLELYLKGFIWYIERVGWRTLHSRYGHDVPKLWRHAHERGLTKYARQTKARDEVIALVGPYYRDRQLNYLDLEMLLSGFDAIRADKRIAPTLLRLTRQLDVKLGPIWVKRSPGT